MRCKSLLAAFVLALAPTAQTLPPGVQKKASLGGITEYDFPNGLRVLIYPDAANPKITVNVVYLVGSRHEGHGETGMPTCSSIWTSSRPPTAARSRKRSWAAARSGTAL